GSAIELKPTTASTMPTATPASRDRGNEARPAITATISPRASVAGPRVATLVTLPTRDAIRMRETVAMRPPMVHTIVDDSFGLTPERRARSALSADASTLRPNAVLVRSQPRTAAITGTMINTARSGPRTLIDPICWAEPIILG